jgi:hypothetical protein
VIGDEDPQVDVAILYPSPAGMSGEQAARLVVTEMLNDQMWGIRAKLGATYGTYARREARLGASEYHLGGAVDAPRAGEALRAMRDGIDALRNGTDFDVARAARSSSGCSANRPCRSSSRRGSGRSRGSASM